MTGMLIDGVWHSKKTWHENSGEYVRKPTRFRTRVEEGSAHPPSSGRYHLYVSLACPWAHRTLIVRALRGLDDHIGVSVVHPFMGDDGWSFAPGDGVVPDPNVGAALMRDIYLAADPQFTGRITVPVLWDKEQGAIVNNESRDIIRMFNTSFLSLGKEDVNLCPDDVAEAIDREIDANYQPINNGVYRAGFAGSQEAYDAAIDGLFQGLQRAEGILARQRFLCGSQLTEADVCLFTTLIRFDSVYHTHFKCNVKRIVDFPHLWGFTRDVYQTAGVRETVNLRHIKDHYFGSHPNVNPTRIVARGPALDLDSPHGRG